MTHFDIILTTFDALKSPDTAIAVDEVGKAILGPSRSSEGWYDSRASSQTAALPMKCKQLSVAHRINFRRVLLVDVLGRKSYLAKTGTARAAAAVALRGETR